MRLKAPLPHSGLETVNVSVPHLLASAIASQKIEGLHLAPSAEAEIRQMAIGTVSASELRTRWLERYRQISSAD